MPNRQKKTHPAPETQPTVTELAAALGVTTELLQERFDDIDLDTVASAELEEAIRDWANQLPQPEDRTELRRLMAIRLMDCDRQNAALDEIDALVALCEQSSGRRLPDHPAEAALIREIWLGEKKRQPRMDGRLADLAAQVRLSDDGQLIRPTITYQQIRQLSDSPAALQSSEAVPVLASAEDSPKNV